eukprot:253766-Rhodomonas_salina.1
MSLRTQRLRLHTISTAPPATAGSQGIVVEGAATAAHLPRAPGGAGAARVAARLPAPLPPATGAGISTAPPVTAGSPGLHVVEGAATAAHLPRAPPPPRPSACPSVDDVIAAQREAWAAEWDDGLDKDHWQAAWLVAGFRARLANQRAPASRSCSVEGSLRASGGAAASQGRSVAGVPTPQAAADAGELLPPSPPGAPVEGQMGSSSVTQ